MLILSVVADPVQAATITFVNTNAIAVPSSVPASPYPSSIVVSGMTGTVTRATATLVELSHTRPADLDILLVGPVGQSVVLMSYVGGSIDVTNVTLTFDEDSTLLLPSSSQIVSGTFRPSNYGGFPSFPSPAPGGPYGTNLAVFDGTDPNGTWNLYAFDHLDGYAGNLAGGWSLTLSDDPVPKLVADSTTLIAENCSPTNGVIDPAETVTVSLSLRNFGNAPTTNLVATLLSTGGVVMPSAPQGYGVVPEGGAAVNRPFSFRADGPCGRTLTATLRLQDGGVDLGSISFAFTLGTRATNTTVFTNSTPIQIGGPFPSRITVSGLPGTVGRITVTFHQLSHPYPSNLWAGIVGPNTTPALLMANSGGGFGATNVTLTFDDSAEASLPENAPIMSGTYKPCCRSLQASFNGIDPNGEWDLFVLDFNEEESGVLAGGWSLALTTYEPVCCIVSNAADLAVVMSDSPDPIPLGNYLTNTLSVFSPGPATATGVTLTNFLPAQATFVAASASQGNCSNTAEAVICNLGSIPANGTATVQVIVVPMAEGTLTNRAIVTAEQLDPNTQNNTATNLTSMTQPPANDNFADRSVVTGAEITILASNDNATKEVAEPDHASNSGGKSVWWSWTAPSSGEVTLTTAGSSFDTLLAVYVGASVAGLSLVASDDDSGGAGTSLVSFNALSNVTYQFAVDGFNGSEGSIALSLSLALETGEFFIANSPREDFWMTDGLVNAIIQTNGVVYLGGNFRNVGVNPRSGVVLDSVTGDRDPDVPEASGGVLTVLPDGGGGWFIGGAFNFVGGMARTNLAHILADKTVDPNWNPGANDPVYALVAIEDTIYVGGQFTQVGGQQRRRLAAVDKVTGNLTAWNPDADNFSNVPNVNQFVNAMVVLGDTVYAGGSFTRIGDQPRSYLVALDATTGLVKAWNPNPNNWVMALAAFGNTIYVGGFFNGIGGQFRNGVAAVNAMTGEILPWNPNARGDPESGFAPVVALAVSCDTIYAGGSFTNIGGQSRSFIAALDGTTGQATSWNPAANGVVKNLAISGKTLYVAGDFSNIAGQPRNFLAALDTGSGQATEWSPQVGYVTIVRFFGLAVSGSSIYVGAISASLHPRNNLAAFDAITGKVTSWNPNVNGEVRSLAISGRNLYVGGSFTAVGGQSRTGLAAISTDTAEITFWNPNPFSPFTSPEVDALAISSNALYVGGSFTEIGGQPRNNLGALSLTTGSAAAWNPNADGAVRALVLSDDLVYAGGDFTSISGQPRTFIVALTGSNGVPTSWNPSANGPVRALGFSSNTVYAAGYFTHIGGQPRQYIAALTEATGAATSWSPNANGPIQALAVSGNTIYAGGSFTFIGARSRAYLAALDSGSGIASRWNPDANDFVSALAVAENAVYAGGNFDRVGGQVRTFFAAFPPNGTPAIISQPRSQKLPVGGTAIFSVAASGPPPFFYQWRFNGTNISNATNMSLVISDLHLSDSGEYSVLVSNAVGAVFSTDASLVVFTAPGIIIQPMSQTVSTASTVSISVGATGSPPPRFQWRLNRVNIPGANQPTLVLTNVQPMSGGSYDVVVDNVGGAVLSEVATLVVTSPALAFANNLADRVIISAAFGVGSSSNVGATREPGETNHVGKVGGASVWIGWQAPAGGIATFSTRGSSFDTLLAIYTGTNVAQLSPVAADEDRAGFVTSSAAFNAEAGTVYLIAVDGLGGAMGNIVLSWNLDTTTTPFPRIISQPLSRAATVGENVTFSVDVATSPALSYQWFFGCVSIPGATNATLTIANVQVADVGSYHVVVRNASIQPAESFPASLEIGPVRDIVSQGKVEDVFYASEQGQGISLLTAFLPPSSGIIPVELGGGNSQKFNNATDSPGLGCIPFDVPGGHPQWFGFKALSDGVLAFDTIGSEIDTLLAAFRMVNPSALCLNLVAWDNNGAPDTIRSALCFTTLRNAQYYVMVDGVRGSVGPLRLNYRLVSASAFSPSGTSWVLPRGHTAVISAMASNPPPNATYHWRLNGTNMAGATNSVLIICDAQLAHSGNYSVVYGTPTGRVTNTLGTLLIQLPRLEAPRMLPGQGFQFQMNGTGGLVIEVSENLLDWWPMATNVAVMGRATFFEPATNARAARFYRAAPWPPQVEPSLRLSFAGHLSGGSARWRVAGPPGLNYSVEASIDLRAWRSVWRTNATQMPFEFNDPTAFGIPWRFYRVVYSP